MSHHHHHHAPATHGRLIAAFAVTFSIFLSELIGAFITGSLALLADAGHMLVDSSGLIIALFASHLMRKPRSDTHTWGYARAEVLAAALQSGMLLLITIMVSIEAIKRLFAPAEVVGSLMLIFGVIGLVGNLISLGVLASSRRANLNMRAAFLEVANDALGSIAVIAAAGLAWLSGWDQWDAIASLAIAALMGPRAIILLRDSLKILMEQVPDGLDLHDIRTHITAVDHVIDVHDLHVSTIATGTVVLTAHVTVDEKCFRSGHSQMILHDIQDCVAEHFPISIEHSTIQLDSPKHRDHERLVH
ncbi:MAG: cation diffusion facilitator family transporter [Bowdeniella nasicola]|nr:cation diffusion facilitator family transporter [Bowdeniella nasicola]